MEAPTNILEFAYAWMSALIVVGLTIIAWLLNKGFETIKEILNGIREDLNHGKEEQQKLRVEFEAHRSACEARRSTDPHLHYRYTDAMLTEHKP